RCQSQAVDEPRGICRKHGRQLTRKFVVEVITCDATSSTIRTHRVAAGHPSTSREPSANLFDSIQSCEAPQFHGTDSLKSSATTGPVFESIDIRLRAIQESPSERRRLPLLRAHLGNGESGGDDRPRRGTTA